MTLRDAARKLLEEHKVQGVLGYRKGSLPFRTRPYLFRDPCEVEELVFTPFCGLNLARYLLSLPRGIERVAIVAKGCDGRACVALVRENRLRRENLLILGVPCPGMVDTRKLAEWEGLKEHEVTLKGGEIVVRGVAYPLASFLDASCRRCRYRSPLVYDILIEDSEVPSLPQEDTLRELRSLPEEKRWEFFRKELSRCIRCYACRNACPMCYCKECFAESHKPSFLHPSPTLRDNFVFHIGRAMHLAGRCVECGACERACPLGIPIATMFLAVSDTVREHFAFEAGVDVTAPAPFVTYREDDPNAFIR